MADPEIRAAAEKLALARNIETNVLLAVVEVESAGEVYALVKGKREPLVRFEGHYLDARLKNGERDRARKAGLASPKAGAVKNPKSQERRWDIINRAAAINRQAALESFSIGLGQVMTSHWKKLGFSSVDELIKLARRDAAGQLELMVRYIDEFGLVDELQRKDFTAFARGYNGPGGIKAGYHKKMAAAYKRISGSGVVSAATGMLRMGSKGARVRELQQLLVRAGHAVNVDGDYGPATKTAVIAFQKAQRITADGVAGPETQRRLAEFKVAPDEKVGHQRITDTPEVREGLGGVVGGGVAEAARQQVQDVADKVSFIPGLEWLSTILAVIAAVLVIGGLLWMAWGWIKSRRTDEGDVEPVEIETMAIAADPVLA